MIKKDEKTSQQDNSASNIKVSKSYEQACLNFPEKLTETDLMGLLNEFAERERIENCRFFMSNWRSLSHRFPHKRLGILAFIEETNTELRQNSGSRTAIIEFERFLWSQNLGPDGENSQNDARKNKASATFDGLTGQFFSTPQGQKYYVESPGVPIDIDGEGFDGLIADRKYRNGESLPSGEELASIRRLARYRATKNQKDVGVRGSKFDGGFVYDPISEDGRVYFIDKNGSTLKSGVPGSPVTVRYPGMLYAAVENGSVDEHIALIRLWHLDQKSAILSMGLDFTRFIPDIPHAIENVDGPHGSGKTTYTEMKRMLFDPSGAPTQTLKFDERDLSISAVHQGMLAFDNVNTAMPDGISDVICRLTTGQGFRTRELYSNTGELILKLKRPIIINGINRVSYRPDFIDRECPIHLGVMPENRRVTDAEIRARAEELIPKVRGFLLSIIPNAMRLYAQVESELRGKLPRMADFVVWGECGIRAMGFPDMSFFDANAEAKHQETLDVARETLIVSLIQDLMIDRTEWEGTTADLLDELDTRVTDAQRKSKAYPKDPRRLGRLLKELTPTLLELSITVDELSDGNRTKRIGKVSSPEIPKVNVSDVSLQDEAVNHGVPKLTLSTDINFLKNSNVSVPEPVNHDVQNASDITDIKNHDSGGPSNIKNDSPGFMSVQLVMENLKAWGFEVIEHEKAYDGVDIWKAKLKGELRRFTDEQQQYLKNMFVVKFEGSDRAPHTWIHFKIRAGD